VTPTETDFLEPSIVEKLTKITVSLPFCCPQSLSHHLSALFCLCYQPQLLLAPLSHPLTSTAEMLEPLLVSKTLKMVGHPYSCE